MNGHDLILGIIWKSMILSGKVHDLSGGNGNLPIAISFSPLSLNLTRLMIIIWPLLIESNWQVASSRAEVWFNVFSALGSHHWKHVCRQSATSMMTSAAATAAATAIGTIVHVCAQWNQKTQRVVPKFYNCGQWWITGRDFVCLPVYLSFRCF